MQHNIPVVLHVVISLAPGGLEKLVVDWTNERNRLHPGSTVVCCLDEPGAMAELVDGDVVLDLHADRARPPWDRRAAGRLRRCCQGRDAVFPAIDVIHSHDLAPQQYAAIAAIGTTTRHVYTQHGAHVYYKGIKNRLRSRVLAAVTNQLVAVSQSTLETMAREARIPRRRIAVVPNGVTPHRDATPQEAAALRRDLGIPADAFVIGSVGRLSDVKGYDRLIRTFSEVVHGDSAAQAVRLLLVGDGPERERLADLARRTDVHNQVIFAGYHPAPRRFLDLMDLFVMTSRTEGLPVALLEAMAAGRPVMVTDVGEIRRVIDDGRAGWLLPDDESEWAPFIVSHGGLIDADGAAARQRQTADLAARARDRVARHYSMESTLSGYESIYRRLCRC